MVVNSSYSLKSLTSVNMRRSLSFSSLFLRDYYGRLFLRVFAGCLLLVALLFNPFLAFVNAQIFGLSQSIVILTELTLVGGILLLALFTLHRLYWPWIFFLAALILLGLLLSTFNVIVNASYGSSVNIKAIRDLMIVPLFIVVGIAYYRYDGSLLKIFLIVHSIVIGTVIFEAFAVDLYATFLDIKSYYIQTRGFTEKDFWAGDSNLFVSAARPNERFILPFLSWHRMSSIFLEPVSLGNYFILAVIFALALWSKMSFFVKIIFCSSMVFLLIASDGRQATMTSIIIIFIAYLSRFMPRYTPFLYLPLATLGTFFIVWGLDLHHEGDNFAGRLAFSVEMMRSFDLKDVLGLNPYGYIGSLDSGIAHLILNQSLLGVVLIWFLIIYLQPQNSRAAILFMHGLALYLSLGLLISYALLSIKTSALLWFGYGWFYAQGHALHQRSVLVKAL